MKNYQSQNNNSRQTGFTLVEMLIYIAIFSILMTGIASFIGTMTSSRLNSQIILEVNDQGTNVINTITQIIRNADSVTTPAIGTTATSLYLTAGPNSTIISITNGTIYMTEGINSPVALTNNKVSASNLVFSNNARIGKPASIQVRFTLGNPSTVMRADSKFMANFYGSASLRK